MSCAMVAPALPEPKLHIWLHVGWGVHTLSWKKREKPKLDVWMIKLGVYMQA